jgi:PAS domain S-box-containing protein
MGVLVTRRRRKELVARHEQALAAVQAQSDELGALRRRYEMLLNATDEGIFGLDVQGKVTFINSAAARILGWMPEELLGQSLHERIHHTYADGTPYPCECCPILETLHIGTMRKLTDDLFWHNNGTAIPVEYVSSPIADGEIVAGVVVVFRDVGDRRRLESQLLQSQKLESIGRLAGGIAHDFNNLLTTIAACAELARDTLPSDHAVQTDLGIILEAAARANILTHQLLSFARKQSIATEIFNLNDLLDGIGELLRRTLGTTIELTIYPAADLWLINADPNQIAQVLLNLVINARDAMSENGKLMIETANVELDSAYHLQHPGLIPGSYVVLSVSDNGEGIPADVQPQIFEPFFTTKASDKGTGLGLSTSYGIVTQHGGQIWMYSEVGQGTTFKVYLPSVHSEPAHVSELIAPLNWGIETILLVEDQEQVRTLACQLLRDYGYTILAAANGETGLQLAQGHAGTIDLLITDIVMPDLGGVQLAEQLALQRSGIKILFISGYPERMLVSNGRLALEQQVLHKPFTAAELLQAVRLALDT